MFVPENLKRGLDHVCIYIIFISRLVFVVLFRSILKEQFHCFLTIKNNKQFSTPKEFISSETNLVCLCTVEYLRLCSFSVD